MPGTEQSGRPSVKSQLPIGGPNVPPTKPEGMAGPAGELWDFATEALKDVLRPLDTATLRTTCEAYARSLELWAEGENRQAAAMARVYFTGAAALGLSPHSRRIIVPVATDTTTDENDGYEAWLAAGGLN